MTATKIPPKHVEPDRHGHRTKEWFVRLPVGMVAESGPLCKDRRAKR